ncbi:MAG: ferrous iron transport protein A [Chloroflexota bacterium]
MITPISLTDLAANDHARVLSFAVGRHAASRFASLGLTPGALVSMIQNYGRGPLIVNVRGARVALGRGEAAKILVERSLAE